MNLFKFYQTNSSWYKGAVTNSKPIGILWHDTAAGNPKISRYMQPLSTDKNYKEMIELVGKHKYKNDFNHTESDKGVNAFIGQLADGSIGTAQMGEWDKAPWGCGKGSLGSCNGYKIVNKNAEWVGQHWIQFEICDDGYKDEEYFNKCVEEACELTAYLCELYGIDPLGTVEFCGVKVPTIICHKDAYNLKLGSNHSDTTKWFKKFGYSMDKVRARVVEIMNKNKVPSYEIGRYEITGAVNVREKSNTNSKILTTLQKGDKVDVVEIDGTWGKTTYNGKTGYFGLKYGKYLGEIPAIKDEPIEVPIVKAPTVKVEEINKTETPKDVVEIETTVDKPSIPKQETASSNPDAEKKKIKSWLQKIIDFIKKLFM